jgi:EpsI family protein
MQAAPMTKRRWSVWLAVAIAAVVFAVGEYLDDHLALPLREISSVIAGWVLDLARYPVERTGTIIATDRFRFDVVPACSGSATLRTLVSLGIAWAMLHPGLSGWRRVAAAAAAVPLAILTNGLRVAALVAIGDARLAPVEGALHEFLGLCTFAVALGGFFLVAEGLARDQRTRPAGPGARWLGAGLLALLISAPALLAVTTAWYNSPLDHHGWVFLVLALGLGWWLWRGGTAVPAPRLGVILCSGAVLLAAMAAVLDVNAVRSLAAGLLVLGLGCVAGGPRLVLRLVPALLLAGLAVPPVGFLTTQLSGWDGATASLVLRSTLAAGLLIWGALVARRQLSERGSPAAPGLVCIAILAVGVALQVAVTTRGSAPTLLQPAPLYLQGDWLGEDLPIDEQSATIIGRERVLMRRYHHDQLGEIQVIITTTGGDRHRAHPPEYCLTGSGWAIAASTTGTLATPDGPVPATLATLVKDGVAVTFACWFTDGSVVLAGFHEMLAEDGLRRLAGRKTDWALIRLFSTRPEAVSAFASVFNPVVSAIPPAEAKVPVP